MKPLALFRPPTDFKAYTARFIQCLGYATIKMDIEESLMLKVYQNCACIGEIIVVFMIFGYIVLGDGSLADRSAAITPLNYYAIALPKVLAMRYYRLMLISSLQHLESISPSVYDIHQYGLEHYLRNYKIVENFIYQFFKYLLLMLMFQPIIQSFIALCLTGEFGYLLPQPVWPTGSEENGYFIFIFETVLIWWTTLIFGAANVACDLGIISCLIQLTVHYDLIAKHILELDPEKDESLEKLNEIIRKHQDIFKLTKNINTIFAPAIALNLFSSTFIICFMAYNMLGNFVLIDLIKTFVGLCYELKQIAIICYYGDKLMDTSVRVFDAVYMHKWYNGSLKYRRQIAFLLMATRQPVAFRIAGTINVSLIALQQVFSNSYQIFAVLKNA